MEPATSLIGIVVPAIPLQATTQWTVVYGYLMTGVPGQPLPDGWDAIPGALEWLATHAPAGKRRKRHRR